MTPILRTDKLVVNEDDIVFGVMLMVKQIDMKHAKTTHFSSCSFKDVRIINMQTNQLGDYFSKCVFYDCIFERPVTYPVMEDNVIVNKEE